MITSFSHIYLPSKDVEGAIAWYTEKLGFKLLRKYTMNGRLSAYVTMGNILLELTKGDNTPSVDGRSELRIGLTVDSMDKTLEDLRAKGVEVVREPWPAMTFWGLQCQIREYSGYLISLREWRAPDAPDYPDWQPDQPGVERLA